MHQLVLAKMPISRTLGMIKATAIADHRDEG